MTESSATQRLALIVDGGYLFYALRDVLGRPPATDERVDLDQLKRRAASMRSDRYLVDARYFDRRQPQADSFYNRLESLRYDLTLNGDGDHDSHRPTRDNIIAELDSLRTTDHDILYVGGYSYNGKLTAALNNLRKRPDGSPRSITIAHFKPRTNFENDDFRLLDIVDDINAAPAHIYAEADVAAHRASNSRSIDQDADENETALGAALHAARESASDSQSQNEASAQPAPSPYPLGYLEANQGFRPGDGDADEHPPTDEAPSEPEPKPQPPQARDTDSAPPAKSRGLLVLIDHENIDGALIEIIRPKSLNRQTRPDWNKLREFVEQRANDGPFVIKAFLQDGEREKGFAGYLRSIGFEAVLLQRESRPDDPYRQRSVVDEAICKNLAAIRDRSVDILLVSHDGDYYDDLEALHESDPDRRIGVVGFVELMNARYSTHWIDRIDLERDIHAFDYRLPNRSTPVTVTTVDDYDPASSLDVFGAASVLPNIRLPASVDPLIAVPLGQKTWPSTTNSRHPTPRHARPP